MRKSQQKPVSEKRWTFDENEKPEKRLGDIREKFEHMIVDGPPVKNVTGFKSDVHHSGEDHNINHKIQVDNHGKIFEIHEKSAPGFESQVLNVRVDQNRNSQNQGTGYKSRVLHSGVDQNRNVPNQDILGKKFAPQESSEKAPVKSDKGEQDIDKLQIKIDDLQKKIGDLLKKIDKGENDKYNLLKQIGDLVRKLDKAEQDRDDLLRILEKTPKKDEEISATIGDLLKKLDKGEQDRDVLREKIEKMKQEKDEIAQEKNEIAQEKEVLKHNLEKMKQEKDEIAQEKGDLVRKLDKAEQDRDDLLRILEKTPKKDEEISATIGDLLKKLDKAEKDRDVLQEKIEKMKQEKDEIAQEKEFPPRVNGIDTFPAIYLLCLLMTFLIIGVFWREYHRNGKTPKKDEEISATIGDLLKKLDKAEKDRDVLWEKIEKMKQEKDEIAQEKNEIAQEKEVLKHNLEKMKQEKDEIAQEKDEIAQEKNEIAQEKEQLKKEIERKRAQFKSSWRDIPLYADWRKEEFQTVNLTLDAATAHPALFLSEEGRRVTWQEPCQELPSSPERFVLLPCVLGQLHVSSGRYFWEVEVQNAHSWDLGVCRNNVERNGRVTMSPQNGFWAIRLYGGEYWGLTSPETSLTLKEKPLRVGVFLDYEARDVSFYNMTDGSHIYTFSKQTFYGVLRPLFRLWSSDSGPLTIVQVE